MELEATVGYHFLRKEAVAGDLSDSGYRETIYQSPAEGCVEINDLFVGNQLCRR